MKIFNEYKYASKYKLLLLACYLFYFCSVAIKLSYSTLLVEIIDAFSTTKASAGIGLTFYYFVYAVAQVILSIYITKISVKKFLTVTSIFSAITFSMISISNELWQVWLILALNGIFQSASWGGITYIITKYFPEKTISYCNTLLITCYAVANGIAYGVSAFFVQVLSWRYVFIVWGALFIFSLVFLISRQKSVEKALKSGDEIEPKHNLNERAKLYVIPKDVKFNKVQLLIAISVGTLFFHIVNYGFTSWIPSLLTEVHDFENSYAIFIALGITIITVPVTVLAYNYFDKTNKLLKGGIVMSIVAIALLVIMIFTYSLNVVYAVIMSAVIKLLIAGITTNFSSYIAVKLKNHINGGTTSLILNSLACTGAGTAPFISGAIMDASGFKNYYLFLALSLLVVLSIQVGIKTVINKRKNLKDYF